MKKNPTPITDGSQFKCRIFAKPFFILLSASLLLLAGCKKDTFKEQVGVCPIVVSTDPTDKAVDVALNKVISVTFNTAMDSLSINKLSFVIKQGTNLISGTVSTTTDNKVFLFKPDVPLLPFVTYNGTITAKATDVFRTAMTGDYAWSFTTIPQVTLSANPTLGGIVTGAGSYAQGSLATVTATANTGFTFTSWTDNGVVVSTSSSYQFTMAGNRILVANFTAIPLGNFAVNLSSSPVAGGTTGGAGSFASGSVVTVTATPNTSYTFKNWTDNGVIVSVSSSYQFILTSNRTLVANYTVIPASQFALVLSSNPAVGGTTSGSGSYTGGTSVTVIATPNSNYTFASWTENGNVVSTSPSYTFALNANRSLVANFSIITHTLTTSGVNGTILVNPAQSTYNKGSVVTLTAIANTGYVFAGWGGDASGLVNPLAVVMNSNKNITALFTPVAAIGPGQVNLGLAGNYNMLTKTGITTTGVTSIQGDLGVSPAAATSITGFGLIMDASGQFSKTPIVTGKVYAADYASPTPANLTTAVNDMQTAYTNANNLVNPAPIVDLYAGNISGRILPPGLYKYNTGVLITNAGVTFAGGPNDTWVIQIAQDLTVNGNAIITLTGGAQAKNIVWVVAGQATLDTNVDFSGIVLSKTLISLKAGTKVTGRLLAQTAVTLNNNIVVLP